MQIFRVDDAKGETRAKRSRAKPLVCAQETRFDREERNELKTGHLSKRKGSATLFLRVKQIYDLIPTRRNRTMCIYLYTCILFCEYDVGLPRRCATQERPVGTKRKTKGSEEDRDERFSQKFRFERNFGPSNLSLSLSLWREHDCTVGGLAGTERRLLLVQDILPAS